MISARYIIPALAGVNIVPQEGLEIISPLGEIIKIPIVVDKKNLEEMPSVDMGEWMFIPVDRAGIWGWPSHPKKLEIRLRLPVPIMWAIVGSRPQLEVRTESGGSFYFPVKVGTEDAFVLTLYQDESIQIRARGDLEVRSLEGRGLRLHPKKEGGIEVEVMRDRKISCLVCRLWECELEMF